MEIVNVAFVPAANGPLGQAGFRVQNNAFSIEVLLYAQSVATTAGTSRVVEREQARFQLIYAVAALRAGESGGERSLIPVTVHPGNRGQALGEAQCGFK